jgi:hypothetical protein
MTEGWGSRGDSVQQADGSVRVTSSRTMSAWAASRRGLCQIAGLEDL